jgi:hypothetical protein
LDLSQQNTPLSIIADLLATAILRENARKNGLSSDIQLDFAPEGSVCADAVEPNEEKAP